MQFCTCIHQHTQPLQKQVASWSVSKSPAVHGCNNINEEGISPRNDPQPCNVVIADEGKKALE